MKWGGGGVGIRLEEFCHGASAKDTQILSSTAEEGIKKVKLKKVAQHLRLWMKDPGPVHIPKLLLPGRSETTNHQDFHKLLPSSTSKAKESQGVLCK